MISLDAARAARRAQVPPNPMLYAKTLEEARERTVHGFFLHDEPLLRFRDFDGGP